VHHTLKSRYELGLQVQEIYEDERNGGSIYGKNAIGRICKNAIGRICKILNGDEIRAAAGGHVESEEFSDWAIRLLDLAA
jgi:hypothetical protein